jgi:hypothetical protein
MENVLLNVMYETKCKNPSAAQAELLIACFNAAAKVVE